MNYLFFTTLLLIGLTLNSTAQESVSSDLQEIEAVITSYAAAGDAQNVSALESVTHEGFRVVFRISDEQTVALERSIFLDKFRNKEFGGDTRTVDIQSIDLREGKTAIAKVMLRGEQATMSNYLNLVQTNGEWVLVSDFVFMGE